MTACAVSVNPGTKLIARLSSGQLGMRLQSTHHHFGFPVAPFQRKLMFERNISTFKRCVTFLGIVEA